MTKTWRVVGIDFDHMHMGDNLRMVHEHPRAEIVGICDEQPERMAAAAKNFRLNEDQIFTDYRKCLELTRPDIVILCPATARHGEWTQKVAPYGAHILMEKPFAANLAEADAMIAAIQPGQRLAINWPLAWYAPHRTAKRLLDEGRIGGLLEVHYYDGNRGPLWHLADKEETTADWVQSEKPKSWFYKKSEGGGSLLDYLGYGTTLGSWYQGGRKPLEVTTVVDAPMGVEVDEHSVTIARYAHGLSKFETRWGTFTDPWTHQPQPKCGFVLVGTEGTLSSYDYEPIVRLQTETHPEGMNLPADALDPPFQNPVQYLIHCLDNELPIEGPLSPEISRIGQQIVDSAVRSAEQKRTVALVE
ncbi:MAG: Gfo/Idh/MocA family oxidoreductase [Candidatus Hydrogenedentes bacterium]|nr:Gfo/Idh/MocA family oxidoreductase [Candidatus Hydrogenedentota bacterium]